MATLVKLTGIIQMHFHFLVPNSLQTNFDGKWLWFLRKASFHFHMYMTLGQGQEMTLTFNTDIPSLPQLVECMLPGAQYLGQTG